MEKYIEKARVLIEALPYIKEFFGKTVVIKYGGSAMTDPRLKESVIEDIVLMKLVGMRPVIVHGGGPEISIALKQAGKEPFFVDGLRVTDKETMEIVEMVLAGKVNKEIVSRFQQHNMNAAGITGKDGGTFIVRKKLSKGRDVGFVGEIIQVNTDLVVSLLNSGFIPVLAPTSSSETGESYNVNADQAAIAIAGALKASKLVFLTDVAGVLTDMADESTRISRLTCAEAERLIEDGTISGGMVPKVSSAMEAVESGVSSVHILDGRIEHSILLEIFTRDGIGTKLTEE